MCIEEFVAYMCGHRSMAVLRTCPGTTAQHNLPVCSFRPIRQYHADTMCSPCERIMHTRWVLIREWEHRFYHERGACGCPTIFPNLITRPRVIGGPVPDAPATRAPGMGGPVAIAGPSLLGAPHPSLPPKPFGLPGQQQPSGGVIPPAEPASTAAGSASEASGDGSTSGSGTVRIPTGPAIPTAPKAPAALRWGRGHGRGRNNRTNSSRNNSSRGERSGAASGSGTSGGSTSATVPSGPRSDASVPVPTITVTPPTGPSGPPASAPVRPPIGPAPPAPIAGPIPPIFSEATVGGQQHIAVRLPGLYAAEWTNEHRVLHEAFPTHCPVETRPVRHISNEEDMTNEERALLEDCRLLTGMDPADIELESMIAETAARIGGIFPGSNSATMAAQALTAGQGPLHPDILEYPGMPGQYPIPTLPEETAAVARSDLPLLGLPVGAGREGTPHTQPFGACRLTRPEVRRRKSCEF